MRWNASVAPQLRVPLGDVGVGETLLVKGVCVGGVGACDYSIALVDLPRLCWSETHSDHITDEELETLS